LFPALKVKIKLTSRIIRGGVFEIKLSGTGANHITNPKPCDKSNSLIFSLKYEYPEKHLDSHYSSFKNSIYNFLYLYIGPPFTESFNYCTEIIFDNITKYAYFDVYTTETTVDYKKVLTTIYCYKTGNEYINKWSDFNADTQPIIVIPKNSGAKQWIKGASNSSLCH
jgi:hypothetical protein